MKTLKALKTVVKPRNIILLIILLLGNTFAWFIYATKVDNEMSAHVRAWNVLFQAGDSPIVDYVEFDVENMYPGMEEEEYKITAYNRSEMVATVSFTITEVQLLDEVYYSKEYKSEQGMPSAPEDLTSAELVNKLLNDYPFSINIGVSETELAAEDGSADYRITVNWAYESGDDAADTYWGKRAAAFKALNPDESCIKIKIRVVVAQKA